MSMQIIFQLVIYLKHLFDFLKVILIFDKSTTLEYFQKNKVLECLGVAYNIENYDYSF